MPASAGKTDELAARRRLAAHKLADAAIKQLARDVHAALETFVAQIAPDWMAPGFEAQKEMFKAMALDASAAAAFKASRLIAKRAGRG